jgi:ElaB/YqjD/DUF883 family membrane-anchored ribosome-binding protein
MANTTTRKEEERFGNGNPAGDKMNKAQQAGTEAADKAKDAVKATGEAVTEAADAGAAAVGGGLKSLAGTVRQQGPHDGTLGEATTAVAKGLEQTGKYLQKEGVSGMAEDVSEMIRRNPIPAVLVGVGIGFMLAQLTRS